MKLKIDFDTDGCNLYAEELEIAGYKPYQIDNGCSAYYDIHVDDREKFFEALENFQWCYFGGTTL